MDWIHVESGPEPVEEVQHNESRAEAKTPYPPTCPGTAKTIHNNANNELYNLRS